MADKVAATYHPNIHVCDRCGATHAHRISALWCCSEGAWDNDD